MSEATSGDQNKQGGGFDFRTLVSVAALIAAGASIYYASTVDSSSKIADLEGSLTTLNTKINALPDSDGVKQLISENVKLPPAAPSAEDIKTMIETATLSREDIESLIAAAALKSEDVQAMIDQGTLKAEDVLSLIDQNTLKTADVQTQIDNSTLPPDEIRSLIAQSRLTEAEINTIVSAPIDELRSAVSSLPDEDKVRKLAQDAAETADEALVANRIPALVSGGAVPKGAVVAFATACPAEQGWKEYEQARGRFLVAAGEHTDANGTSRTFVLGTGDDNGEYEHTLTTDEMPAHSHGVDRQGPTRGIEGLPPIGTDGAIIETLEQEMSQPAGLSNPHNNVPPYIALYFCEKT